MSGRRVQPLREASVEIKYPRHFNYPVVVLLRDDQVVEVYLVDQGLEHYAGRFDPRSQMTPEQVREILKEIRAAIVQKPLSVESSHWLDALRDSGMLRLWENQI